MTLSSFWFDWEYDRRNSNIGSTSRYSDYLSMKNKSFQDIARDDPADLAGAFAVTAWRVATGPVMAPPLVRCHPRIAGARVYASAYNGRLVANVALISPRPRELDRARTETGSYFEDNHRNFTGQYEGVGDSDLERHAYLLTEVRVLWEMPPGRLPQIPEIPRPSELFDPAVECIRVIVSDLNRQIDPIIAQMDGETLNNEPFLRTNP